MAIFVFCSGCNRYYSRKTTSCTTCGKSFKGSKKFRVNLKTPQGSRVTRVVEGSLSLARNVEAKLKAEIAQEKHLGIVKAPLIEDVWDDYIKWSELNKKSWKDDKSRWGKHVASHIKGRKMDALTPVGVEKILGAMAHVENPKSATGKGCNPATVKNVFGLIRGFYNWAIKRKIFTGENPCASIELPKFDNRQTNFLSRKQMGRLVAVLDSWENRRAALLVKFAFNTGMRQGEITSLTWDDVDLRKGFVTIRNSKGVTVNTLPLSEAAVGILKEVKKYRPGKDCPYCFPNRTGGMRTGFWKNWMRIREKAKLPKEFRFHDLRHTFATYIASSGEVDLYTLQKLMTHKSPQMTQRYAHLLDETLRKGVNVAGKVLNSSNNEESIGG